VPRRLRQLRKAVRQFLSDLQSLVQPLELIVAGLEPGTNDWLPLTDLLQLVGFLTIKGDPGWHTMFHTMDNHRALQSYCPTYGSTFLLGVTLFHHD
jgi:hypothetical protein